MVPGIEAQMRRTRLICVPWSSLGAGPAFVGGRSPGALVFEFLVFVTSGVPFDNAWDVSYASRIQLVTGASTSSRCLIRIRCATLVFDAWRVPETCGPFSARPRNTHSCRYCFLGRTKQ